VTDRQTDGRTPRDGIGPAYAWHRAAKRILLGLTFNNSKWEKSEERHLLSACLSESQMDPLLQWGGIWRLSAAATSSVQLFLLLLFFFFFGIIINDSIYPAVSKASRTGNKVSFAPSRDTYCIFHKLLLSRPTAMIFSSSTEISPLKGLSYARLH